MILDQLGQAKLYANLNRGFGQAFEFLRQPKLAELPLGRHEIDGERVYATISRQAGRVRAEAKLEAHRQYIDIHYLLAGSEELGWRSTPTCQVNETDFDPERDFELFQDAPCTWFSVVPGQFLIFYPADAHIPLVGSGELHKVVIKVAARAES